MKSRKRYIIEKVITNTTFLIISVVVLGFGLKEAQDIGIAAIGLCLMACVCMSFVWLYECWTLKSYLDYLKRVRFKEKQNKKYSEEIESLLK